MVVRKTGGPNVNKKKAMEENKMLEKKKLMMMKEEESEDEEMTGDESDDEFEMEGDSDDLEGTEEDEEGDDDDDDDDEEEEEEEESDENDGSQKLNKNKDLSQLFADKRMNTKTPNKTPAKTVNKTPAKTSNKLAQQQQNSQKKQIESKTPKTPKQQNILQSKSESSISPKKKDDNQKPAMGKQQKNTSPAKKKLLEMAEEEDDDDDDDDDDDEEEEEEDEEEEDDDDDDDDEEEEEDEEDEGDDDDDEPKAKKAKTDTPSVDLKETESKIRQDRDCRSLFVRGFPDGTTEEEIKALSPDILFVRIPFNKRNKRNSGGTNFAFVQFSSEKKAEENFEILQKKKFKGQELFVDFVGGKSKNRSFTERMSQNVNKQRLFIGNLPKDATMEDLGKAFPEAMNVYLNSSGANKTAQISFNNEEAAAEALKKNSALKVKGIQVVVLYAQANRKSHVTGGRGRGRGMFTPNRSFRGRGGPGFQKSFHNQRRPMNQSLASGDDDDE